MSEYRDFVIDLPKRSIKLLNSLEPHAKGSGLDVTFLLMVASTAFVVPRERLSDTHPAGDSKRFPQLRKAMDRALGGPFVSSPFFGKDARPWLHGRMKSFGDGPDSWRTAEPLTSEPASYVLAIIRNALSHGNLFTKGNPISEVVFFSEEKKDEVMVGYKYLILPAPEFRRFLLSWFNYIEQVQLPYRDALSLLAKAA